MVKLIILCYIISALISFPIIRRQFIKMRSDDDIFHPSFVAIIFSLIPFYNLSLFVVGFIRFIFLVINIYKMKKAATKHKDAETVSKLDDIIKTFKDLNN